MGITPGSTAISVALQLALVRIDNSPSTPGWYDIFGTFLNYGNVEYSIEKRYAWTTLFVYKTESYEYVRCEDNCKWVVIYTSIDNPFDNKELYKTFDVTAGSGYVEERSVAKWRKW